MGKSFKRLFALCLAAVMVIASSLSVMAAPASPTQGGKNVEPVITKRSSTTNTKKGTVSVYYKSKNADQYVIQYKLNKDSWKKASKKTTSSKNITLTGLKKGGLYAIRIAGVKNNKQGKWSKVIHRLMNQTKATATSKNGKIIVKLPKTAGATGYQIKYSTRKDFSGAKIAGQKASSKQRTISGLKKGKTYYLRVTPYAKVKGVTYWGQMYTLKIKVK